MRRVVVLFVIVGCLVSLAATSALAVTEIQWWHAMGGALGEKLTAIAEGFNQSQAEYKVVPVYKGTYAETMTAGIAAFRSKQPPHILQVFEVGTATMMAAKGAIKPVHELMTETGEPFDPKAYLSAVTGYYSTTDGKMLSMPFNSSTPILYYNKDGFKQAGLDPERPPKTWPEVEEYAKKLIAAGFQCGFSTSWTSWIHMENFSAWHNQPVGTKANGFQGFDTEFVFNTPLLVKHVQQMSDWQKDKIFAYGGRTNKGNSKFSTGECAMYTESSAGYAGFKSTAKFEFGTGMLPYWPDAPGTPQNTIIGGASLWVMAGLPAADYKGVAKFFSYLSSPEVQADWHQFSGYLPITTASYELTKQQGFYDQKPGTETPILQMTLHAPNENSLGIRFGNFPQMRDIMDDEFEAIFAGKKTAEQGMADAVKAGNELLRKFEAANK